MSPSPVLSSVVSAPLKRSVLFTVLLMLLCCAHSAAEAQKPAAGVYPTISYLDRRDALFSQLTDDVAASRRAFAGGESPPPLVFYRYTVRSGEDLLTVAARTNLGVETIATVNSVLRQGNVSSGMELILPNIPGVFAAMQPVNDLERMILALRYPHGEAGQRVLVNTPEPRHFVFFEDESFHPVERAYFLGILFRFPLRAGYISSGFGMRTHPITGKDSLHFGIDIAAPQGTGVIAARGGKVLEKGYNAEGLGNYVLLAHEGGYTTLYGHLSTIAVTLNQEVNSGSLLGTVGSTGLSTGPHLHFEVRSEGKAKDPVPLIYGKKE